MAYIILGPVVKEAAAPGGSIIGLVIICRSSSDIISCCINDCLIISDFLDFLGDNFGDFFGDSFGDFLGDPVISIDWPPDLIAVSYSVDIIVAVFDDPVDIIDESVDILDDFFDLLVDPVDTLDNPDDVTDDPVDLTDDFFDLVDLPVDFPVDTFDDDSKIDDDLSDIDDDFPTVIDDPSERKDTLDDFLEKLAIMNIQSSHINLT